MADEHSPPPPVPQAVPPEGWYRDPDDRPGQRYWDGSAWTDHFHPDAPGAGAATPGGSTTTKDPANNGMATIGWITAVLLPFIGAIIGIVLMSRKDSRGGSILILSAVVFVIGLLVISSSGGGRY